MVQNSVSLITYISYFPFLLLCLTESESELYFYLCDPRLYLVPSRFMEGGGERYLYLLFSHTFQLYIYIGAWIYITWFVTIYLDTDGLFVLTLYFQCRIRTYTVYLVWLFSVLYCVLKKYLYQSAYCVLYLFL